MMVSHLFSYRGLTAVLTDLANEGNEEEKKLWSQLYLDHLLKYADKYC